MVQLPVRAGNRTVYRMKALLITGLLGIWAPIAMELRLLRLIGPREHRCWSCRFGETGHREHFTTPMLSCARVYDGDRGVWPEWACFLALDTAKTDDEVRGVVNIDPGANIYRPTA